MIDKKEYPLFYLRDIKLLYQNVRKIVDENNDIIEIVKDEDLEIIIKDSAKNSRFTFTLFYPQLIAQKAQYTVQYNPGSIKSLDAYKNTTTSDTVIDHLKHWAKMIREYESIYLSPEEKIINEYAEEFYSEFEIIDEDADVKAYDLVTQIKIHNYLLHAITILEKNEVENKFLIEEANNLKEDLTKLTKKATVKRLSKFFAKVRQKSLPLLKELFEEAKKELFKRVISNGFDKFGGMVIDLI